MFKPVSSRVNLPQQEEEILKLWQEKKTFERSVANRQGGPRFTFYEGPPTANGMPGIHHVLARVFKDIMPRYKTMKGYYAPRIAGWDTHGLPVELEVEKKLGFSNKADIERYGIAKFNERCRESVFSYLKEWNAMTERIAFWVDLEHPYVTMDNSYIETVWWAIKQMWDKGLVYQGFRVTPHCPRCGTSLSSHEVAQGYKENTVDPSVFIKFKISPGSLKGTELEPYIKKLTAKPAYLLAWTTTPWTLPGNTALAVAEADDYAIVDLGEEYLILADARRETVKLGDNEVVGRIKGSALVGVQYEPLFNPHQYGVERLRPARAEARTQSLFEPQEPDASLTYKVITTNFVSMEEGTGIVHVAPAFGEADFDAGLQFGLNFVQPVDLQGKMTGSYPFAGKFVKTADPLVLDNLKSRGLLYRAETIKHTYPFCWRCDTPLIYYAKQSWYIRTTAVKEELIKGNQNINWYPDYIKYGRFGDWLENNVDWAFSRERYWGTPLPVWRCEKCSHVECVGSMKDLREKPGLSGLKEPLDLHRPYVDDVTYACSECGGTMRRLPEVIDCWFDSGSMPIAQYHYPFENGAIREDGRFPADFICEAVDQTRGWFYSLHAIATLLFGQPSYRNVICLGHILDAKGEKMSKSRGNVVQPMTVINKHGADALRWYFYTSSPPGNARRFAENMVSEADRFLLTLWNVYSFFVTYANIDNFVPDASGDAPQPELDRWITSEMNQLIMDVDTALGGYDPTEAGRKIENFVNDLSNWYVRRSRRRFWKSESDTDKISAYNTLYNCLVTLAKLMAPFTPFIAEEVYQNLVVSVFPQAPDSVHLTDFPVADMAKIDKQLTADISLAIKISSLGRAARSQASLKVRQPLTQALVGLPAGIEGASVMRVKPQILEELNVKDLQVETAEKIASLEGAGYSVSREDNFAVAVPTVIPPELKAEGTAREIVHRLQTMRRSAGFEIADYITTFYQGDAGVEKVMADFADYIKQETLTQQLVGAAPPEGAYSESLKLEGQNLTLAVKKLS